MNRKYNHDIEERAHRAYHRRMASGLLYDQPFQEGEIHPENGEAYEDIRDTIAHHEAAHAMMRRLLGMPATTIEITGDGGYCHGTGERINLLDNILYTLAGYVLELHCTDFDNDAELDEVIEELKQEKAADITDFMQIVSQHPELLGESQTPEDYLKEKMRETREMLSSNGYMIDNLADLLHWSGTVHARDVADSFDSAFKEEQRDAGYHLESLIEGDTENHDRKGHMHSIEDRAVRAYRRRMRHATVYRKPHPAVYLAEHNQFSYIILMDERGRSLATYRVKGDGGLTWLDLIPYDQFDEWLRFLKNVETTIAARKIECGQSKH